MIAIQAMAAVAQMMSMKDQDMIVTAVMGTAFSTKVRILEENSIVYNRFEVSFSEQRTAMLIGAMWSRVDVVFCVFKDAFCHLW